MTEYTPVQNQRTDDFTVSGCSDTAQFDAGSISIMQDGKLISIDVTLKNVCPKKRVALAALLTELGTAGTEQRRGLRCMTVPGQSGDAPADILVQGIRFVLPEDIALTSGGSRKLRARFTCHYIDSETSCFSLTV